MSFRIGQKVRVTQCIWRTELIGEVTTVTSVALPFDAFSFAYWVAAGKQGVPSIGTPMQELAIRSDMFPSENCWVPVACLEPIDDGRDAIAWTAELRNLCGVKRTERA